jgi:hypothetical protein
MLLFFPQPVLKKKATGNWPFIQVKSVGEPVIDLKRSYLFRKEDPRLFFQ